MEGSECEKGWWGVNSERDPGNSKVWWRKHHGIGLYRMRGCGKTCRGWGKDECWAVCGHLGEQLTAQHGGKWNLSRGSYLSVGQWSQAHLQKKPRNGWRITISLSWTGLHSLQTSILLNTFGIMSKENFVNIQHRQREFERYKIELQMCGQRGCQELIDSMSRIGAVIKAQGGHTKY